MNSRKIVEKTLTFDSPERIPRQVRILPWAEETWPDEVSKLRNTYPDDIVLAPAIYKKHVKTSGDRYYSEEYVDEWGCKFINVHKGVIGIVQEPLIARWEDLKNFRPPESTLNLDKDEINAFCRSTDKFVLAGTLIRPFERLNFIRTMEQSLIDLSLKPPELLYLLHSIHDHYCKEVEAWARTEVDAIYLMDDWGMEKAMLVSPDIFRKYFKPMYMEYAEIARFYRKYVFMHSDGCIKDIIPDLIEVGISALNSQLFCMDIKELGDLFRGKITFWGEIDRQNLLPNGTTEDIRQAVHEVYENLYDRGGLIAQCEFGPGAKPENVMTVFETWEAINQTLK